MAGRRLTRDSAKREGKGNGAGGFARRRERGEGVRQSRTRRDASEARRGELRTERHIRKRARANPLRPENAHAAGRVVDPTDGTKSPVISRTKVMAGADVIVELTANVD